MSAPTRTTVDYPTSDGKPMAETDLHRDEMFDSIRTLEDRYADRDDVYVSGNLLIYYERGNKRKHVAPDTFVVFGVPKRKRLYYLAWEEGKFPDVLIEITSKTTKREDLQTKKEIYRTIFKAKEYFLFDPTGDYLKDRLRGFRRVRGQWKPIAVVNGTLFCKTLGLELHVDGIRLRFFDPEAGKYLLNPLERAEKAEEAVRSERARADSAQTAQRRLAEENERLRREIEALRRPRPNGGNGHPPQPT
ncbi:MAG: Uma2 family endonuclease [Gemmataceae bacterium]